MQKMCLHVGWAWPAENDIAGIRTRVRWVRLRSTELPEIRRNKTVAWPAFCSSFVICWQTNQQLQRRRDDNTDNDNNDDYDDDINNEGGNDDDHNDEGGNDKRVFLKKGKKV